MGSLRPIIWGIGVGWLFGAFTVSRLVPAEDATLALVVAVGGYVGLLIVNAFVALPWLPTLRTGEYVTANRDLRHGVKAGDTGYIHKKEDAFLKIVWEKGGKPRWHYRMFVDATTFEEE